MRGPVAKTLGCGGARLQPRTAPAVALRTPAASVMSIALLLWLLIAGSGLVFAPRAAAQQEVWRCGPEGRSYGEQPCADGRRVDVADPRDEAQRAQAQAVAERAARLAQQLVQQRRQREREAFAAGQGAAQIKPQAAQAAVREREPSAWKKPRAGAHRHLAQRHDGKAQRPRARDRGRGRGLDRQDRERGGHAHARP